MKKISVISLIFCVAFCAQTTLSQESVGKMEDIKLAGKTGTAEVTRKRGATGTESSIAKKDTVHIQDILQLSETTLASVTFDDGGYVKMRKGTRMEILSIDEIFLTAGHLFVNSKWHAKKGRRFKIKTKKVTGGTVGTEFYMFQSDVLDSTALFVFKGAVNLMSTDPATVNVQGTPVVVKEGQGLFVVNNAVQFFNPQIFKRVKSETKSWQGAMGPKGFPVWGVVVPAAAVAGGAAGLLILSGGADGNNTASGTIRIQIPPGN